MSLRSSKAGVAGMREALRLDGHDRQRQARAIASAVRAMWSSHTEWADIIGHSAFEIARRMRWPLGKTHEVRCIVISRE